MNELKELLTRLYPHKKQLMDLIGSRVSYKDFDGFIYAFSYEMVLIAQNTKYVEVKKNEFFRIQKYKNEDRRSVY